MVLHDPLLPMHRLKLHVARVLAIALIAVLVPFTLNGCGTVQEAARQAAGDAVGTAIERELASQIAGYTDVMLYQLAHTQVFHLGGYGFYPDNFSEGEGATWDLETRDGDETMTLVAERALLERLDDGTSWWYLRYHPEDQDPLEYEIRLDGDMRAHEMYFRDPESGEIQHHTFAHTAAERTEADEGEENLEEAGFRTDYRHLDQDAWGDYREERVTLTIGGRSFDADLLTYTATDPDHEDRSATYRWWVNETVPGHLLRYEFSDDEDARLEGRMTAMRDDYQPKLRTE